jgi:His/Glu/Gln/Arg/opine family amino acid ABC transporter permease subunit
VAQGPPPPTVEPGHFTFAVSGEYRPFSYVDADQVLRGFDVDVGNAIARELGLTPAAKKYKFAAIVEGVRSGRFDAAVASHTVTPERAEQVSFSTPYYYSGPQIFTREGSAIRSAADLAGAEVAVSKGSSYEQVARGHTDRVRLYDSDVTALAALAAGRHAAVITDFVTGEVAISEGMKLVGQQRLGRSEQAIAVSRENTAMLQHVDAALQRLRASGELSRLSQKYFRSDITRPPDASEPVAAARDGSAPSAVRESSALLHFFQVLVGSRHLFLEAAALTLRLTIVALLVACSIGLVFALLRLSRVRALNLVSNAYVYLVRGTPLIVQIFVLYFGLTSVIQMSSFWAAALALAFHNGAYVAEIFRGAIQSIDRGQMEAGRALGMSSALTYRRVVMPQAALRALPPLGNQMIIALKDSSLAAFISMNELFNVATTQGANHFDQMTYLLVVAVYYLALVLVLQLCVQWTETKLGRGIYA